MDKIEQYAQIVASSMRQNESFDWNKALGLNIIREINISPEAINFTDEIYLTDDERFQVREGISRSVSPSKNIYKKIKRRKKQQDIHKNENARSLFKSKTFLKAQKKERGKYLHEKKQLVKSLKFEKLNQHASSKLKLSQSHTKKSTKPIPLFRSTFYPKSSHASYSEDDLAEENLVVGFPNDSTWSEITDTGNIESEPNRKSWTKPTYIRGSHSGGVKKIVDQDSSRDNTLALLQSHNTGYNSEIEDLNDIDTNSLEFLKFVVTREVR